MNQNDTEKKLDQLLNSLPKPQYDVEAWLAEEHTEEFDRIVNQRRRKTWLRWGSIAATVGLLCMMVFMKGKEEETVLHVPGILAVHVNVAYPHSHVATEEEKLAEAVPPQASPQKRKSPQTAVPHSAVRQMTPIDSLADIVERIELAMQGVRDSCYMANVEKLMHTDDRLQHLVNQLILEGITADPDINTAFTDLQHND